MTGREVGRGLVRERRSGLIVADHAIEPLVGRFVRGEIAQVARGHAGRDPDQARRLHPVRARRLHDLERPVRVRTELALEDLERVGGGIEHHGAWRPRPVVDAHDRITNGS